MTESPSVADAIDTVDAARRDRETARAVAAEAARGYLAELDAGGDLIAARLDFLRHAVARLDDLDPQ